MPHVEKTLMDKKAESVGAKLNLEKQLAGVLPNSIVKFVDATKL